MSLQAMIPTMPTSELASIVNRPPNIKLLARQELERRGIAIRGNTVILLKAKGPAQKPGRTVGCWHCGEYLGREGNNCPGCGNPFTWEPPACA